MTPEQIAQLQRFQAGEQLSDEEMAALYPAMVDSQIKRAKGAQAREFIFNALSQGIRAATGLPFQQSLRNRRLAEDQQRRALARDTADQDATSARTKYFELKQNFVQGIVDDAQASVTPENEAEIKRAELESQREGKLLEMVQGANKEEVSEEDEAARMAAQRYINAVSQGRSKPENMKAQMSRLKTPYALNRFAYWVNVIVSDEGQTPTTDAATQKAARKTIEDEKSKGMTDNEAALESAGMTATDKDLVRRQLGISDKRGFYTQDEHAGIDIDAAYGPTSVYREHRKDMINGGTLRANPQGFSDAQMMVLDRGDVDEAMQRSKSALTKLSALPGIEEQIKKVAGQNLNRQQLAELGEDYTAGDVFDKISGLTQAEAFATDARTQSQVSQAMDILMGTGDYSPLTGDKRMLNDMQNLGLNPKEYAFYLKKKYQGKAPALQPVDPKAVEAAVKVDAADDKAVNDATKMTSVPSKPPTPSAAAINPGKPGDPKRVFRNAVIDRLPGIKGEGAGQEGGGGIFIG